jgi:tetratricopeptide (TPR) repeat protein
MTFIPEFEDALVTLPAVMTLDALLLRGIDTVPESVYDALQRDDIEAAADAGASWYRESGPGDWQASLTYAILLEGVDEFDEALEVLVDSQTVHPDSVELKLAEAEIDLERGDDERAEQGLLELLGDTDTDTVERGDVWGFFADLLLDVDRVEEAVECLERAVECGTQDFETYIRLGELRRESGEHAGAAECFEEAAELRNVAVGPWERAVECWQKAGDERRLLHARRQLLELRRDDPEEWARQGVGHRGVGELDEAIECLEKAVRLAPESTVYRIELAETLRNAGQLEDAIAAYDKVLEAEPDYLEAIEGLVEVALAQGDIERAERMAEKLVELGEGSPRSWWLRGRIHRERHRLNEAVEALSRAVELDPGFSDARRLLGQTQLAAGETDAGRATMRRAVEDGPADGSVAILMATALLSAKSYDDLSNMLGSSDEPWSQAGRWQLVRPALRLLVESLSGETPQVSGYLRGFRSALDDHAELIPLHEDLEELRRFALAIGDPVKEVVETMIDALEGRDVDDRLSRLQEN